MRGIISAGGYVPYRRLQRSEIAKLFGSGGGRGTRSVAGYDEDTTTMGVEAARSCLAGTDARPDAVWFATADPSYLEKTNATAIHAALRLDSDVVAIDTGGAVRSGIGSLAAALRSRDTVLVVASDRRSGLPTSGDESASGDGAAALLVGDDDAGGSAAGPVIAEYLGGASATEEFIDRWRTPGDPRPRAWEERFGETRYLPLGTEAWNRALKAADLSADDVTRLIVTGPHGRAVRALAGRLGVTAKEATVDDLSSTVGQTGTAHPALLLTSAIETAEPGQVIAVVSLADGVDVLLFRTTPAVAQWRPAAAVASQIEHTADLPYGKYLSWRDQVTLEPPRRPEPERISASVSSRNDDWKYGLVASRDRSSGALHMPPARVSRVGDTIDDMAPAPMADVQGRIAVFTVDRIAYSPSPPIVFAVVDFDGGGRLPVELTDVDADSLEIGQRVEMTFRRLFTADGIHNYFWKARPLRG
jgi:3-hydroxy-3-methylglutaryl CoA synthase